MFDYVNEIIDLFESDETLNNDLNKNHQFDKNDKVVFIGDDHMIPDQDKKVKKGMSGVILDINDDKATIYFPDIDSKDCILLNELTEMLEDNSFDEEFWDSLPVSESENNETFGTKLGNAIGKATDFVIDKSKQGLNYVATKGVEGAKAVKDTLDREIPKAKEALYRDIANSKMNEETCNEEQCSESETTEDLKEENTQKDEGTWSEDQIKELTPEQRHILDGSSPEIEIYDESAKIYENFSMQVFRKNGSSEIIMSSNPEKVQRYIIESIDTVKAVRRLNKRDLMESLDDNVVDTVYNTFSKYSNINLKDVENEVRLELQNIGNDEPSDEFVKTLAHKVTNKLEETGKNIE